MSLFSKRRTELLSSDEKENLEDKHLFVAKNLLCLLNFDIFSI
jgi:hypothetical protein